jgi:histidinol-phosphate phosphatase family protein
MNLQRLQINSSWTLFLDRDGVINRRLAGDYVKKWDQFDFLPGVLDAMQLFHHHFRRIIIVSNQQGVGKGLMTEIELQAIHHQMTAEIAKAGGRVDSVLYSPHLNSELSVMRKPNIGMALKARKLFPDVRFNQSVMAGDSLSDMIFGKRCGMKTVLISHESTLAKMHHRQIDYLYPDLISLANDL